ncbi:MerR family DNA-binding transcriptional regulator, partial [Microbacterium oleivorans]
MRIGEVAAASGVTTKALRFYEERGLLPQADRATNGYRDYPEDTIV